MDEPKFCRIYDDDGEYETSMLARMRKDGSLEIFYTQTRKKSESRP
jgi:hypothetical protein